MDVVINIDASIDRLRSSLRDVREEARRTKQAIESQPIQITATGSGIVSGGGYVGSSSVSGGIGTTIGGGPIVVSPGGGIVGGYVGARSGVAGGGAQQFGGSASDIAAEAAMFGIASEARRRFAATARPGSLAASSGGGGLLSGGGILNAAVRGALVIQGIRGAVAFGRGVSRLRSDNLDDNLAGIDDIGSVPLLGDVAREISETVTGTSTRQIREGLASSEAGLNRFRQTVAERQRANRGAFTQARAIVASATSGAAGERLAAEAARDTELEEVNSRVADKQISGEAASALKRAIQARFRRQVEQIDQRVEDAVRSAADTVREIGIRATGDTRRARRAALESQLDRENRRARETLPLDEARQVEAANAARLGEAARVDFAEAGLAAGGRADRVASAEIGASVAVLRAKGENLRAEREEFERTSELKIAAAEREAEALKDIDRERSEAAKAEAKALRIEAGGQRAAFEIAVQRQTADATAEARFIRIGTNQGQLSEQIARIGGDTLEAIRAAAGSPELAKARGEVGVAQLERIARQLDEAVAGTQASVSTRGSFLSAQVGGLNDPNRETVATLKGDIATVLRQIESNTRAAGGAVAQ